MYDPVGQWNTLVDALGLDRENRVSKARLSHMGRAGQAEANRLVFTWAKPARQHWVPYVKVPQVYEKSLGNAVEEQKKELP